MRNRDRARSEYRDTRISEIWTLNEQRCKFEALFRAEDEADAQVEARREGRVVIAQGGGTRLVRRSA